MSKMMDELKDAKEYAEKYKECYLKGDIQRANKYKEMAEDEETEEENDEVIRSITL